MQSIRKRLTYANVMSSLAVFLILGGGAAIAASQSLPKKSVGSKQLKSNAITTAKIKANAVTGKKIKKGTITGTKIKNDSLTGTQINESTLGTVPSAGTASNLTGWSHKGIIKAAPTNGASLETARAAAPEIPLFSAGPFSIYAKCLSFGTAVRGDVLIKTTNTGSIFSAEQEELSGATDGYLDPGTPEDERVLAEEQANPDLGEMLSGEDEISYYAMAPDGTAIWGNNLIAVKNGNPPGGDGLYGGGNVCLFAGNLQVVNG